MASAEERSSLFNKVAEKYVASPPMTDFNANTFRL